MTMEKPRTRMQPGVTLDSEPETAASPKRFTDHRLELIELLEVGDQVKITTANAVLSIAVGHREQINP